VIGWYLRLAFARWLIRVTGKMVRWGLLVVVLAGVRRSRWWRGWGGWGRGCVGGRRPGCAAPPGGRCRCPPLT
jgi:hypothetical protein